MNDEAGPDVDTSKSEWSADWPITEGWYWLYGHDVHMRRSLRTLYAVKVWIDRLHDDQLVYSYVGGRLSQRAGAGGVWQPIPEPQLPEGR